MEAVVGVVEAVVVEVDDLWAVGSFAWIDVVFHGLR